MWVLNSIELTCRQIKDKAGSHDTTANIQTHHWRERKVWCKKGSRSWRKKSGPLIFPISLTLENFDAVVSKFGWFIGYSEAIVLKFGRFMGYSGANVSKFGRFISYSVAVVSKFGRFIRYSVAVVSKLGRFFCYSEAVISKFGRFIGYILRRSFRNSADLSPILIEHLRWVPTF
jgi:hypothetical protein